jgi:Cof subfamily protein (haloacid dehalogenase superfamily)
MTTKYIFLDIDGTMLSTLKGVSKGSIDALNQARRNGHKVFICTGRSKSYVDDYIRRLPFDGFIYGAGSHVSIDEETLFVNHIPREEVERLLAFFSANTISYILEGANYSFHEDSALKFFRERMMLETTDTPYLSLHKVADERILSIVSYADMKEEINKISIFAKSNEDLALIKEKYDTLYNVITYPTTSSCEIIGNGINKASGINHVLKHYGGDLKDCFAIGDSMNDYEMIRECGIGIAMGNADPKVKAIANYVTDDVDHDGISHAFSHFGLI